MGISGDVVSVSLRPSFHPLAARQVHALGARAGLIVILVSVIVIALVLDHALKPPPKPRDVDGVRLMLQRAEDAAADRSDVGVPGPTGDGEVIRHLDVLR